MLQKEGKKKSEETNATPFNILQQRLSGALCKIQDKKKRKEKKILIPLERGLVQNENKKNCMWTCKNMEYRCFQAKPERNSWPRRHLYLGIIYLIFFFWGQMFVKIDSFFFFG